MSYLNIRKQGNAARDKLALEPEFQMVERDCHSLVGMRMTARPYSRAHTYFTAAINTKYGRLIVFETDKSVLLGEQNVNIDGKSIKIYPMRVAKENYDSITGHITPDGCDHSLAWGRQWFFCALTNLNN